MPPHTRDQPQPQPQPQPEPDAAGPSQRRTRAAQPAQAQGDDQKESNGSAPAAAASVSAASSASVSIKPVTASSTATPPSRPVISRGRTTRHSQLKAALAKVDTDPALVEWQRQCFEAIKKNDPYTLQQLIRPNIEQAYTRDKWMELSMEQIAQLGFSVYDLASLGKQPFDLPEHEMPTTLLHLAARKKSIPCMRVLLRNGCDINVGDGNGAPPLDEVAFISYMAGLRFLLDEGADLTCVDLNRNSVLHTAAASATLEVVKHLVEENMNLDITDVDGFTPIMWTLDHEDTQMGIHIADYLQRQGADVSLKDKKNTNIIHWGLSKVLDRYTWWCNARDKEFATGKVVLNEDGKLVPNDSATMDADGDGDGDGDYREHSTPSRDYHNDSVRRLPMLEFLLTLEGVDLCEKGEWKDKATKEKKVYDVFEYIQSFIADDEKEVNDRITQDTKKKEREEKAAANAAKKAANEAAKRERKRALQQQSANGASSSSSSSSSNTSMAVCTESIAATSSSGAAASAASPSLTSPSASASASPISIAAIQPATLSAGAILCSIPSTTHTDHDSPCEPAVKRARHDMSASVVGDNVTMSVPPSAAPSPSPTPSSTSSSSSSHVHGRYILDRSYFDPPCPPTVCQYCTEYYPDETIPEACARLIFMELLRRATNEGDFGNEAKVRELLEMRKKYSYLNRRLVYHQHGKLPRRVGPLHVASSYEDEGRRNLAILRLLIDANIRDDTFNDDNFNALHFTCNVGDVDAVRYLLTNKCFDPNVLDKKDKGTGLFLCVDSQENGAAIAKLLLEAGANLYACDEFKNTAFHWAVYRGNIGVLNVLLEWHKNKQQKANEAISVGGVRIGLTQRRHKQLLEAERSTSAHAPSSTTPVHPPSTTDPFTHQNHWGNSVMHYACYKAFKSERHFDCLRALLDAHVPVDTPLNHSNLSPRQVVAGAQSDDLRGARVIRLLDEGHFIPQPHVAKDLEKVRKRMETLVDDIDRIVQREKQGFDTKSEQNAKAIERRKLEKEYIALEAEEKKLLETCNTIIKQKLSQPTHKRKPNRHKQTGESTEIPPTAAHSSESVPSRSSSVASTSESCSVPMDCEPTTTEPDCPAPIASVPVPGDSIAASSPLCASRPILFYSSDISRGREATPIELINCLDTGGLEYTYITSCIAHPDLGALPLPRTLSAQYDPLQPRTHAQIEARSGNEKQKLEQQLFRQKQKQREAAQAASGRSRRKMTTILRSIPRKPPQVIVEEKPGPRCMCTGPNACMDASCPCFRYYNDSHSHFHSSSSNTASSSTSSSSASNGAVAPHSSSSTTSIDPVYRMGKLLQSGRTTQLCNCHDLCGCGPYSCPNRHVSNGIHVRLYVSKTREKGWACYAGESIKRGTFICQYAGELVPENVASDRLREYDRRGIHYVFGFQGSDVSIDPVQYGNVGRMLNHSCNPNVTKLQIYGSEMRRGQRFPVMAFFAARDIAMHEELCISYDYEEQEHPGGCLVCYCGEAKCRHTLV